MDTHLSDKQGVPLIGFFQILLPSSHKFPPPRLLISGKNHASPWILLVILQLLHPIIPHLLPPPRLLISGKNHASPWILLVILQPLHPHLVYSTLLGY